MLDDVTATEFAIAMGFDTSDLHTNGSVKKYERWKAKNCQPNFWQVIYCAVIASHLTACSFKTPVSIIFIGLYWELHIYDFDIVMSQSISIL